MSYIKEQNHFNPDIISEDETDFIPLLSIEDEDSMNSEKIPPTLSILPLRNTVLFPGVVIPITVGRDKSINLVKDAYKIDKIIGVVSQKSESVEEPTIGDLNTVGTVARIIKLLKMPDGNVTVIIQGKKRFKVKEFTQQDPYYKATTEVFEEVRPKKNDEEFTAIVSNIKDTALQIVKKSHNIPSEAGFAINNIESPNFMINFISGNINATTIEKQSLLGMPDLKQRATKVLAMLNKELQLLELKNQIHNKVKVDLDKQQRDYFLHQQIKTIQEELGEKSHEQDILDLKERAKLKKWAEPVAQLFEKSIHKLSRTNPNSSEYVIQNNYVELLLDLPWDEKKTTTIDIVKAEKILNQEHFGLEKIKDRIIEHLAVLKLKGNLKSPIICLNGPPGVGKTSLGKSIANAIGRKYVRMSLGGLKDESEIRGHRKTYIGAMPGRVLLNLKKVGVSNPVFVLDEIDKIGNDYHGDPSSALLEVLDPEQNNTFYDNFLEFDYDLSNVMFIATSNNAQNIQPALRDRMEIIDLNGYTVEEKIEIAKTYLIPKQIEQTGIKANQIKLTDVLLEFIIEEYTAESGVRGLDKKLAKLARHIALHIVKATTIPKLDKESISKILGPSHSKTKYQGNDVFGVVTGLAWTQVGGDILFIETSLSKGKGEKLTLTGNLGDVMKESATLALEFIKSHCEELKINQKLFEEHNIHIHVPEGATPKDGPSAGIAMLTSLASILSKRKVKKNIAMSGEITLRGKVLPVGGIKEKILAAKRAGIKEIILCADNKKDVEDINQNYLKGLKFIYVSSMTEVLKEALV